MTKTLKNTSIIMDLKNNYGTTSDGKVPHSPTTLYCLHGQPKVELRGHCHKQRSEGIDVKARKKLIIASILCLFFMVAEIVGGVLSNSLAIATDAAHLLTDFASFMISLFAIWLAGRPSTQRMSFGWYRAEVIGALASVVMIWVITAILVWLAIQRLISGEYEVDAKFMLITSVLALVVNLIMGFQLHGSHSHGHSHGSNNSPATTSTVATLQTSTTSRVATHIIAPNVNQARSQESAEPNTASFENHIDDDRNLAQDKHSQSQSFSYQNSYNIGEIKAVIASNGEESTHSKSQPTENLNVRAAFIHVLGDLLQSVGVFVAALVIYFKPEWAIADPICTFIFSIIVLFTTFGIMKDALLVLMEGTPNYLHYAEVMGIFQQIEGVERVHNLRIWALSINKVALSAHLAIGPGANPKKILQEATTAVHLKYNFFETTIQIEDFTPEMENCQQCSVPDT